MHTIKTAERLIALVVGAVALAGCSSGTNARHDPSAPGAGTTTSGATTQQPASYQFPGNGAPATAPGQSLVISLPADLLKAAGPAAVAQLRVNSFTVKPYPLSTSTACAFSVTPQLVPGGRAAILSAVSKLPNASNMSANQKISYALMDSQAEPLSTLNAANPTIDSFATANSYTNADGSMFVVVSNCSASPTDTSSLNNLNFVTTPTTAAPDTGVYDSFAQVQIATMAGGILSVATDSISGWQRDSNGNWIVPPR